LRLNALVNFLAMYGHGRGCCDTDTHLIALDPEHGHRDVIANLDGLADASRKNEHLKHRLVEHSAKYLTLFTRKQLRPWRAGDVAPRALFRTTPRRDPAGRHPLRAVHGQPIAGTVWARDRLSLCIR
jgi:hypothetical protein